MVHCLHHCTVALNQYEHVEEYCSGCAETGFKDMFMFKHSTNERCAIEKLPNTDTRYIHEITLKVFLINLILCRKIECDDLRRHCAKANRHEKESIAFKSGHTHKRAVGQSKFKTIVFDNNRISFLQALRIP